MKLEPGLADLDRFFEPAGSATFFASWANAIDDGSF